MSGNINKRRETARDLKNSVNTGSIHSARDVTERKVAENFLRESEERYRFIVEGVNAIGWEYDPSKDYFTFVSGKAQEITGYTPKQWREKGFWESHIHPADRDFAIKYCENATKRGEDFELEYRMITADGGFVWFRDIVQVVFNNGKVAGLRGMFIDITKQKHIEGEFLQGKKVFEGIFNGIQDGICVLDKNLKILHVNHAMNKRYSHSLPLTGKQCFQAYHKRSEPCVVCPTLRAIEKGVLQMDVVPFTGPHGRIGWLELFAFPLKDEKNNVTGVIEYVRDITEKKKMEELLKSSSEYLQKLNDSLGDVIVTVKFPERVIEYANCTVERVFGYKPEECIGKETKMFYSEVEGYHDFGKLLKNAIKEGKNELRTEKLFKRKNGEIFPCEITTTFLKENEKIVRVISILHDISERKEVEKSLLDYKQQMYAFSLATTNMLWNWDLINGTIERNIGFEKAFGYTREEIVPNIEWWVDRLHPDDRERVLSKYESTVKKGDSTCSYEYRFRLSDGNYSHISDNVYIVRDENGKAIRSLGAMTDITKRKEAEEMLQKQKKDLEQKNIALREVLSQIELERKQVKDNVIANTKNLLLPILEKIRLKGESRKYVNLLRKSLQELTSSFGIKLTEKEAKLTSREIEICNMIKNGLASVEIADLLNISLRTIEKHRANVRKKLGITKKRANLTSFLKTL